MQTNIILKIKNQKELDEVQEFVFENGGKWVHKGTDYMPISYLYDDDKYIMITDDKYIVRLYERELRREKEQSQALEIAVHSFLASKRFSSVFGIGLNAHSLLFGNPKPTTVVDEFVIKIGDKHLMGSNITKNELLTIIKEVEE